MVFEGVDFAFGLEEVVGFALELLTFKTWPILRRLGLEIPLSLISWLEVVPFLRAIDERVSPD